MIINLCEREHTRACLINGENDIVAGGDHSTHLGGKKAPVPGFCFKTRASAVGVGSGVVCWL